MSKAITRDLGDGLILRQATEADAEALATFNADVHRDSDTQPPDTGVLAWVRDLMTRPHPRFEVGDFILVEDTHSGTIVSSSNLISQTWTYEGVQFGVGRPELVGTHPAYRKRGLVRAQFEVIHRWSAERGHQVQAITGIPWFYRQFGYEMALALGASRAGSKVDIPKLKEGDSEPYRLRQATEVDLAFIALAYQRGGQRSLVTCVRDEALWQYELSGRSANSAGRQEMRIIETPAGEPVGFLAHATRLHGSNLAVGSYELVAGVSWLAVTPTVLRYLQVTGSEYAARDAKGEFGSYTLYLGAEHPVYRAFPHGLPVAPRPYAWYLRVADIPSFLRLIAPALERRLAESELVGYSGELKISSYRRGVSLLFDSGRIAHVGTWTPAPRDGGGARFPDLTFLQLLFGYRSLEELEHAFADCGANREIRPLLNALFPKRSSSVWPVS